MESPEVRRRTMQAVKSKDTAPELLVRSLTHRMGYRFRLHRKDLPGKPDLVFPGRRKAIFVHGCFWHGHDCARGARVPKENRGYWVTKIGKNRERDLTAQEKLKDLGWKTIVFWECELRDRERLRRRLLRFLGWSS
jgi:DNA mismatch endonuclease (patch repair protein)